MSEKTKILKYFLFLIRFYYTLIFLFSSFFMFMCYAIRNNEIRKKKFRENEQNRKDWEIERKIEEEWVDTRKGDDWIQMKCQKQPLLWMINALDEMNAQSNGKTLLKSQDKDCRLNEITFTSICFVSRYNQIIFFLLVFLHSFGFASMIHFSLYCSSAFWTFFYHSIQN